MSPLFRYIWSKLRDARSSKYLLLMVTPIVVKPMDFHLSKNGKAPLHMRLKGLWGLPLITGGAWAWLTTSVLGWVYGKTLDPTIAFSDAMQHLNQMKMIGEPLVVFMAAAVLYGISIVRWGYHYCIIRSLKRWWPDLTTPRLLFFVINTSGMGLWAALFGAGLFLTIRWWDAAGEPEFVLDDHNAAQPIAMIGVLAFLSGLQYLATQNSVEGMKTLYSGRNALRFWVEVGGLVSLTLFAYALIRLV